MATLSRRAYLAVDSDVVLVVSDLSVGVEWVLPRDCPVVRVVVVERLVVEMRLYGAHFTGS